MNPDLKSALATSAGLFLLAATGRGDPLVPFTTDKYSAMQEAQRLGKLVLLTASLSNCANCQLVKNYSLQTTNPGCRQMVEEVFVYWDCPMDAGCLNYTNYVPDLPDGFTAPLICVIDPATQATQNSYLGRLFGPYNGASLLTFFRRVVLVNELPQSLNLANNGTINTRNFTVQGMMKWTNVPTAKVCFQLNGGAWSNTASGINWTVSLAPFQGVVQAPATNVLKVYLSDQDGYHSQTNTINFFCDTNAPTVVGPVGMKVAISNGVVRLHATNLTASVTNRLERNFDLRQTNGWTFVTNLISVGSAADWLEGPIGSWGKAFYRIRTQP
jgi:hypothetical protein